MQPAILLPPASSRSRNARGAKSLSPSGQRSSLLSDISAPHLPAPPAEIHLEGTEPETVLVDGIEARGLAHDARNLLSAIGIYCHLLAEPGVLAPRFFHYAADLEQLGGTGACLIDQLVRLTSLGPLLADAAPDPAAENTRAGDPPGAFQAELPGKAVGARLLNNPGTTQIIDLGREVFARRTLLAALAGPEIQLEVEYAACAGRIALSSEGLLRILVNLVTNAAEALRSRQAVSAIRCSAGANPNVPPPATRRRPVSPSPQGRIRITVQLTAGASFQPPSDDRPTRGVVLSVRDNGPGLSLDSESKYGGAAEYDRLVGADAETFVATPAAPLEGRRRGLGLTIVRRLVEQAGGRVRAVSSPRAGMRFDVELPLLPELAPALPRPRPKLPRAPAENAHPSCPRFPQIQASLEKNRRSVVLSGARAERTV